MCKNIECSVNSLIIVKWIKARYYRNEKRNLVYSFKVWEGYVFSLTLMASEYEISVCKKRIINPDYRSYDIFKTKVLLRDYFSESDKITYNLKIKKQDLIWLLKIGYTIKDKCLCDNMEMEEHIKMLEKL